MRRCSDSDENSLMLTPLMVEAMFHLVEHRFADADEIAMADARRNDAKKDDMFPYGPRMPSTNIPVSHTGPVQRCVCAHTIHNALSYTI